MSIDDTDQRSRILRIVASVRRVWRNPAQLRTELGHTLLYWRLRSIASHLRFSISRRYGDLAEAGHRQRLAISVHRQILVAVLPSAALALSAVVLLQIVEDAARSAAVPGFQALIEKWKISDPRAFAVPLLSSVVQIGGVFLALYFATISVVASANYSRVPPTVRALLTEEQIGTRYVQLLAFVTAFSALSLLSGALGYDIGVAIVVTAGVLGVYAVFSFLVLGKRAFHFFDPAALAADLPATIVRNIKRASHDRGRWTAPSFQRFCQQSTEQRVTVLRQLGALAIQGDAIDEHALGEISRHSLRLQAFYSDNKNLIPTRSLWFAKRLRHGDWFLSSSSDLILALNSGSPILPKEVEDLDWLDRLLASATRESLAPLLETNASEESLRSMLLFSQMLQECGHNLLVAEAIASWERMLQLTVDRTIDHVPVDCEFDPEHSSSVRVLGVLDAAASGLSSILIGVGTRFQELAPSCVQAEAPELLDIREFRRRNLPRAVVREAERLGSAIGFENKLEGRTLSEEWYLSQLLALAFGGVVVDTLDRLSSSLERVVETVVEPMLDSEKTLPGAQLIVRFLETVDKADFHLHRVKSFGEALTELRKVEDIPWFELDDSALTRSSEVRRRLVRMLARLSDRLYELPRSDWAPDYFGQAYALVADRCWRSLVEGNDDDFAVLFPVLFEAALKAQVRLFEYGSDFSVENLSVLLADPLEDLALLSGYAIAFEDLSETGSGTVVRTAWDQYLERSDKPAAVVQGVLTGLNMLRSSLTHTARSMVRTSWKQEFEARLRKMGLLRDFGEPRAGAAPLESRTSLASLLGGRHSSYDGVDIFLAAYLADREEATGLQLPVMSDSLRPQLLQLRTEPDRQR